MYSETLVDGGLGSVPTTSQTQTLGDPWDCKGGHTILEEGRPGPSRTGALIFRTSKSTSRVVP